MKRDEELRLETVESDVNGHDTISLQIRKVKELAEYINQAEKSTHSSKGPKRSEI